jgi:hypothetical protein
MKRLRVMNAGWVLGALMIGVMTSCAHTPREVAGPGEEPAEPSEHVASAQKPKKIVGERPLVRTPVTPQQIFDRLPGDLRLPAHGVWDPIDTAKAIRWINENQAGVEMTVKGVVRTLRPKLPSIAPSWAIEVDSFQSAQGRLAQYWIEGEGPAPEKWMATPAGHRTSLRGKLREVRYMTDYYAPTGALLFTLEPLEPGIDETVTKTPPLIHKVADVFPQLPKELQPDKDGTWTGEQLNSNIGWTLRYLVTGCRFESTLTVATVMQPKPQGKNWSLWVQTKGEDANTFVLLTFVGDEEMIRPLSKMSAGQKISVKGVISGINSNGLDHMPDGRERLALNMVLTMEKWAVVK